MPEELTAYDMLQLVQDHYDEIEKVWIELTKVQGRGSTLIQAATEWAKRNGRDIQVKSRKPQ